MGGFEEIVASFVTGVIGQKEAIAAGDTRLGNMFANQRFRAWDKLRAYGDEGREALVKLLDDERVDVREMAAAYLLRYRTAQATKILQKIATTGEGLAALGAQQCLRRWEEGTWELDPEDS